MIKVAVDCFGGDNSPAANVEGALSALEKNGGLYVILTGDEQKIRAELEGKSYDKDRLEIIHAPDVIDCDEKPTDAVRYKKDSSLMAAVDRLRTDDTVAGMVSVGSTGA
ncbi:MAG: phosphate--acyl-ACP acyltransferase, partial [Clostridia bacterium]|nr:phosphate--acyl-ACP acyltransferase [Clostridia bacterium]